MNPELLRSFLSAGPTGRQFGSARIAAGTIGFHWGVAASDPASAFEDVLSLDTSLARKKHHADSGKANVIPRPPIVGSWQIGRFGCLFISRSLILKGCPDRCGLVIYKQDMKAGFLPTQPDPNPWRRLFSPKHVCEIFGDVFFGLNWEDCERSITPETFAKKPIWLHCNRRTSRGLWKQPGPRMRVHNHLPIRKIQRSSLPKIAWETCSESIQFSPSLFKYSLTLARFWQSDFFHRFWHLVRWFLRKLRKWRCDLHLCSGQPRWIQRCGGKDSPTRWWMIHIWWHLVIFIGLIYVFDIYI